MKNIKFLSINFTDFSPTKYTVTDGHRGVLELQYYRLHNYLHDH